MIRNSAHRRTFFKSAIPACERKLQSLRHLYSIVEEHFVKVSQSEKENAVLVLILHLQILPHHWGNFTSVYVHCFNLTFLEFGIRNSEF